MTPESFNAALAQRKLEAADILLIQAKRGSDADRIRAASAILRIAFFPVPSASSRSSAQPSPAPQAEGLPVSSRRQSEESSTSAAASTPPNCIPTPPGSYSAAPDLQSPAPHPVPASPPFPLPGGAGEGCGERVTTLCSQFTDTSRDSSRGIPVPSLSSA